jgi:hypothetical protein
MFKKPDGLPRTRMSGFLFKGIVGLTAGSDAAALSTALGVSPIHTIF